jgi:hypothetical protein
VIVQGGPSKADVIIAYLTVKVAASSCSL